MSTGFRTTLFPPMAVEPEASRLQDAALLRAVLDACPGPVHLVDAKGVLQYVNLPLAELFGVAPEAVVGRRLKDVHPDPKQYSAHALIDARVLLSAGTRASS